MTVAEPPQPRLKTTDWRRVREDRALFTRYLDARDPVDRTMVAERFLPLARQLASRYAGRGEPFDDLLQVACLGLVKAIDRYDPDRGSAFSSFATPTIVGELRRHFRDRTWAVRVPRELQELALRADRQVTELVRRRGRQPTVAELAHALGVDEEQTLEALGALRAYRGVSLATPSRSDEEEGETLGDAVGGPEPELELAEHRATLSRLLHILTPREHEVLSLRFEHDLTQAEIGERIGVSQMQVSRILRAALARLNALAAPGDDR